MTFNFSTAIAVGIGGFLGAILRFYISIEISRLYPHSIPLSTLFINITGSFIMGIFVAIFLHFTPSDTLKGFLTIGFLGALTTYSTFAIESYTLLQNHFYYGVLNIFANAIGTIISVAIGYKIASKLLSYS